ncbi:HotDog domain-containing protein [Mycena crocata]|nr:HotDog domain-containing protein [Mycena crocata]
MSTSLFLRGRTAVGRVNSVQLQPRNGILVRTTTSIPNPPSSRRSFSPLATVSLVTGISLGAYLLGAVFPPSPISLLYPQPAPPPPSDATSTESLAYTAALEAELQTLPMLQAHRAQPDAGEWYETRPHEGIPDSVRVNKLTSGTLRGPGKLALFPLARVRKDESAAEIYIHLGRGLCGHDGIVHGGLLATLLDEALGRNAIINLPEKVGVTATLSLKYKAPTRADQFVVMKTQLVEAKGRKARVSGRVEDLQGTVLVEAEALFVQPRYAKLLSSTVVRQHMGVAPTEPVLAAEGEAVPK